MNTNKSGRVLSAGAQALVPSDIARKLPQQTILNIFRKTCINRYFEYEVARVFDAGIIKMPVYLSIGQEHVAAAVSEVLDKPLIFAQHRGHSYYLSFGGDMRALIDELLHRETGCAGGMGGSASIHSPEIGMFGHSGLMGDQVPIAVGAALGSGKQVLTVVGDASAEEDYVYGAMGYAATKKLPVLFLCEDNNLSILTEVAVRRSWSLVDVADGLGLKAIEIVEDDPWSIVHAISELQGNLPAFVNIQVCRHHWHAGTGVDGAPSWNRFEMFKEDLARLGFGEDVKNIEAEAKSMVERIWEEQLQKGSDGGG
jgi:acetoin:2,6-dichlorophenolindophenol oxidoreductase subunit alpha